MEVREDNKKRRFLGGPMGGKKRSRNGSDYFSVSSEHPDGSIHRFEYVLISFEGFAPMWIPAHWTIARVKIVLKSIDNGRTL